VVTSEAPIGANNDELQYVSLASTLKLVGVTLRHAFHFHPSFDSLRVAFFRQICRFFAFMLAVSARSGSIKISLVEWRAPGAVTREALCCHEPIRPEQSSIASAGLRVMALRG
jgi:hypothetical protein